MNVAKWLLSMLLVLPLMELAAFIAVSAFIGFGWALGLVLAGSLAGLLILRHVERLRVALDHGNFTVLRADSSGGPTLLAGILPLVPGFITDLLALLLLLPSLRRAATTIFDTDAARRHSDGVIDLAPEQWHQIQDPRDLNDPATRTRFERHFSKWLAAASPERSGFEKSRATQHDTVLVPMRTVC